MNKFQVYFDVPIKEVLIEHDDEENDMLEDVIILTLWNWIIWTL